jgi:hypothetical protein
MKNLFDFVASIVETNGGSYNLNTRELNPKRGYFVSIKGFEQVSKPNSIGSSVSKFISENGFELSKHDRFVGAWLEDGELILDVSVNVLNLDDAKELGNKNDQTAIFDAENQEVIYLK